MIKEMDRVRANKHSKWFWVRGHQ